MKRSFMMAVAAAAFVVPAAAPLAVLAQDGERGERRGAALQNGGEARASARAQARARAQAQTQAQAQAPRPDRAPAQEIRQERREARQEARQAAPPVREQRQERRQERREVRQETRQAQSPRDPSQPLFRNHQDIRDARAREDRQNARQERREDRQENRQDRREDRQERRADRPNSPGGRADRRDDRWDRRDDRRDDRFDRRQDRRDDRFERRQDRREYREFRQRFNSDQWRRNWNRSHRSDWWRSDRRFRGYSGLRVGFYFAPGYGYYQVPRSYWGQRYQVGHYLPSIFWRYQLNDWRTYGLGYPPEGTRWVLVDNHIYLIDQYDGYIIEVINDAWRW